MPHHFDPESAEQPSMAFPLTDVLTGRSSRSGCNTPSMTLGPTQMSFVIPSGERVDVELTELSGLSFNHPLNANASLTIETHSLLWIDTNGSGSRYSNRSLQVFFANEQLVTHLRNLVEGRDWAHNRPHAVLSAYECGVPSWANPLIRRGLYRPWMRTVVFIASILFIVNTLVLALVDISAVASEVAPLLGIPSGHSRSDQSIQASTDTGPRSQSFAQWRLLAPLGPFVAIGRRVCTLLSSNILY